MTPRKAMKASIIQALQPVQANAPPASGLKIAAKWRKCAREDAEKF